MKEASTLNNSRQIFGLKVKRSNKAANPNILTIMMMQMRAEAEEGAHDRRKMA